jgi:hypothetical protein
MSTVRRSLVSQGLKYRHEFEHRTSGIVAIYSYGPSGHHTALVRESLKIMRDRFGVKGATTYGGISGWPQDGSQTYADYNLRTVETQTIFCIDAVSGPNRPKLRLAPPAKADWFLSLTTRTGGRVDGHFAGPLETEETWRDVAAEELSGTQVITEATVRALLSGRYWFLADEDAVAHWKD